MAQTAYTHYWLIICRDNDKAQVESIMVSTGVGSGNMSIPLVKTNESASDPPTGWMCGFQLRPVDQGALQTAFAQAGLAPRIQGRHYGAVNDPFLLDPPPLVEMAADGWKRQVPVLKPPGSP